MSRPHYSWKRDYKKKKSYKINVKTEISDYTRFNMNNYKPTIMVANKGPEFIN